MTALKVKRRRAVPSQLADHAEPCEVRVLLSGTAIYPAQAVVKEAAPVVADATVPPLTTSFDYNGTWEASSGFSFVLTVKGNNPEKGKVIGTFTASSIIGGSTKFKGKISNGDELNGKTRGKLSNGLQIAKFKAFFSMKLTDSTHLTGELEALIKGAPPSGGPFTATKV